MSYKRVLIKDLLDNQNHSKIKMATQGGGSDKYRCRVFNEGNKNIQWNFGAPPNYEVVNKLFEEGRTKIWPPGSLGEKVQNLIKSWEMEMMHKTNPDDYIMMDTNRYTFSLNGRKPRTLKEMRTVGGSYNAFLETSLPEELRVYNPAKETLQSSHKEFTTTFPRGFALEVLEVYCGPPVIVYKFRHWAYMEGPFKGHAPTGEMVQFFGMGVMEVDDQMKIVRVEFFFDRGELLGALLKGAKLDGSTSTTEVNCPFLGKTG